MNADNLAQTKNKMDWIVQTAFYFHAWQLQVLDLATF